MPKALADVLAAEDDFEVCNGLYSLLVTRYGKHFDPATLPVEHRTVFSVWNTNTLIGNGGFNGFLKLELPGDPDYEYMLAAYEAVGCEPATTALRHVLDLFPDRIIPEDPGDRLRVFVKGNNAVHGALNRDFLKAANELTAALAFYIRSRPTAFADVEKPGTGYSIASAPTAVKASPAVIRTEAIALKVTHLPRWARAAFHAHCAHLAFSLWDDAWPESPHEYRDGVEQAIMLAELCAAQGQAVGDLKAASRLAICTAEAAASTDASGRMGGPAPADPAAATNIAIAAAVALDYISGDDDADVGFATAAIESARRVDLMEQVQGDFLKIKKLAREGGWTEKTPVPPEIFRADFESSGKSWWKRW